MSGSSNYRRQTFARMLRRLREGAKPSQIKGDRDILQAAIEQHRKEQR